VALRQALRERSADNDQKVGSLEKMTIDSFDSRDTLSVGGKSYEIFRLDALQPAFDVARLPYSLKVLLENLLRNEDGSSVTSSEIEKVATWVATEEPNREISFTPGRVLMQDFTGVPAVVDLAAMRDAMQAMGGDPKQINPLQPAELVIDHSIQVDEFATRFAYRRNAELEFERNRERYAFLRWGQNAFDNFFVVPPNTGICHQVNLEYLARAVDTKDGQAFPDTLVGTDSHTTMINGLGVLGWGVGGIEAEAAMLGQPISMLVPQVVGFKLQGALSEGATATDLVLTVTQMLRDKGVVGKFVEFYGGGLANLPLADRATIGNMSPEYGATCGIFPIDTETLRYLRFTGRSAQQVELVEAYAKEQGLFHDENSEEPTYSDTLELDLSEVEPSLAGPKRPQDRIALRDAADSFSSALDQLAGSRTGFAEHSRKRGAAADATALAEPTQSGALDHGYVVIAAITSCTNTSNPSVMVGAGLVARKAVEKGLKPKPWVKTSLAPGSKVVTEYLTKSGLDQWLDSLGFNLVGYGCTTCIGNSGPLSPEISEEIGRKDLAVCSVLSGNRNFEGRINPDVKMNYLASPPLVVCYALAGRMDIDIYTQPLGYGHDDQPVYLKDLWPSQAEIRDTVEQSVKSEMFTASYGEVFGGDENWTNLEVPGGDRYEWEQDSTYVKRPPYFEGMPAQAPEGLASVSGARILALLGDSVTTDHISPAGAIKKDSPAGRYLAERGFEPKDFNSYGSRRGNHEVMMRGTFANVRLRNYLAGETEGGFTVHLPDKEEMSIFDAAMRYAEEGIGLGVLAGKEYGSGSSRDWAAKGPRLLGVQFVIAESYERIHRSNLVGMGVLPLQFPAGESAGSLGLSGYERFDIAPLSEGAQTVSVRATKDSGESTVFEATVRLDTPKEWLYYRHGGILQYVLRDLLAGA
jgi:aconitate hydratase